MKINSTRVWVLRMNTQLVAMEYEGEIHYGELSDAHIFRGAERRILLEDAAYTDIPTDWKAYLNHLPHIHIERVDGTWVQSLLWNHDRALTVKGYIIPIIELHFRIYAKAFPKIIHRWEIQPPTQGRVPTALVHSKPNPTTNKVNFLKTTKDVDVQTVDVQTVAVAKPRLVSLRRLSVTSTDALSEKIHTKATVRICKDSVGSP